MPVDAEDVHAAAKTIGEALTLGLGGYDVGQLSSQHGEGHSVAGGLFAVATAIEKLAEAVESLRPGK